MDARRTVLGLDSIRFICALVVVLGHAGAPPIFADDAGGMLGALARGFYNNLFCGPAAVIVFFVISGFCIHYPHVGRLEIPNLQSYVLRRYIRIGIPLFAAIFFSSTLLRANIDNLEKAILWSIYAELIYYTVYPLLLRMRLVMGGWRGMIVAGFVLALGVIATDPTAQNYASYGVALNWLLGLPCWMLGCHLAERTYHGTLPKPPASLAWIYGWRLGIWGLAWTCSVLRFHSPIGYPWLLNVFGLAAYFWLTFEIANFRARNPWPVLEWAGKWSYSLYLSHPIALALLLAMPFATDGLLTWPLKISFVLAFAFCFAMIFEFPSHALARAAAKRLATAGRLRVSDLLSLRTSGASDR